jgi:hypothetical protein
LTVDQQAELARLHAETVALVDWFIQHQGFRFGDAVKQAAAKARDGQRLGDMRSIAREMRTFINELPAELNQQVVAAVEAASGLTLAARFDADVAGAQALLAGGTVRTQTEYDVLRAFVEQIGNDPGRAPDVKRALSILDSYTGSGEATT